MIPQDEDDFEKGIKLVIVILIILTAIILSIG
jgi:hypothetical protein